MTTIRTLRAQCDDCGGWSHAAVTAPLYAYGHSVPGGATNRLRGLLQAEGWERTRVAPDGTPVPGQPIDRCPDCHRRAQERAD